jgi:hypothetical protein
MRSVTDVERTVAPFYVHADFEPSGDQPQAIDELEMSVLPIGRKTVFGLVVMIMVTMTCGCSLERVNPIVEVATWPHTGNMGDHAMLEGVVSFQEGCLTVKDDWGEYLVFFPESKVSFTRSGDVRLFGKTVLEGDLISLGGGYYSSPSIERVVPESCATLSERLNGFYAWTMG